jgi:drug/metabolite transporter (DMT)-like permease
LKNALALLGERIARAQQLGVASALAGVVLITAG